MRNTMKTARCAPVAIAAMLALGPTMVIAQTAPQTVVLPGETPAATAPSAPVSSTPPVVMQSPIEPVAAPEIVLPTTVPSEATTVPSTDNAASTATKTKAAPTARTGTPIANDPAPAKPAPVAARSSTAPAATNPSNPSVTTLGDEPVTQRTDLDEAALAPPAIPAAATSPTLDPAPVDTGEEGMISLIALALVGLIPIGLALAAVIWWRRRSRVATVAPRRAEIEGKSAPTTPQRAPVATLIEEPVSAASTPRPEPEIARNFARTSAMPHSGASVALPSRMPETFEERDALIRRMIAAKPDRANPFRSPKARARRAKLILQSLGRTFENVSPRFDLSQYSSNWPALAARRTSYAA